MSPVQLTKRKPALDHRRHASGPVVRVLVQLTYGHFITARWTLRTLRATPRRNSLDHVSKGHVSPLLQAEIAVNELGKSSRQQVLNLITTEVTDDGSLATQSPFEPHMFFAEAAARELSKPHVGLLLHAGFPI